MPVAKVVLAATYVYCGSTVSAVLSVSVLCCLLNSLLSLTMMYRFLWANLLRFTVNASVFWVNVIALSVSATSSSAAPRLTVGATYCVYFTPLFGAICLLCAGMGARYYNIVWDNSSRKELKLQEEREQREQWERREQQEQREGPGPQQKQADETHEHRVELTQPQHAGITNAR